MLFNTFEFLWFFPIVFCIYYFFLWVQNQKMGITSLGNSILLVISYGLYIKWKPVYALILLGVTLITYCGALLIEKKLAFGKKKYLVYACIILTILPLLVFKYYNFLNDTFETFFGKFGITLGLPGLNWAMPLGISFFTFQAVGYLADVYLQRIKAEKNWWDYMLFISFFPQIASGPISKYKDLMPQIKAQRFFKYEQAVQGLKWILWGMFMKVVMADRVGIYVNSIFDNYEYMSGLSCWIGSILYTFQIYGDFAGYSFMAVGVGELLGFELINNFRRPYLSQSITEFWHRWHISLSTWLKDYIYIPLGGSRCSKIRNYWNIFVTFLVSGIWHGANWTFIVWGMMHGVFQIIEKALGFNRPSTGKLLRFVRIIITFLIVNLAWVFFRMPTLEQALTVIKKMFFNFDTSIATITPAMLVFCVMSVSIVLIKDLADEYLPKQYAFFHFQNRFVRWGVYVAILCLILTCGVFDASQFIYVNF